MLYIVYTYPHQQSGNMVLGDGYKRLRETPVISWNVSTFMSYEFCQSYKVTGIEFLQFTQS